MTTWFVVVLLIKISEMILLVLLINDSPFTFGLFIETNHWKFDETLALRTALTAEPLQISRFWGIFNKTFGCTWTVKEEAGPTQPSGLDVGVIV